MTVQLPDPATEDCRALSSILARVGDKWTVLIVVLLGLPQGAAELGQFVIHTLRSGGEDGPRHQAVSLQSTQREREHPLGDAADHPPDLIEALRAIAEQDDDEHGPLVAYARQNGADGAAICGGGT